jgi:hypothetical protein
MLSNSDPLVSSRVVVHDFLDESECVETVRRVNRLQDRWTKRSEFGDSFTLGAAAYLDAEESRETYLAAAAQTNPALSEAFGDLYGGLRGFLESLLAEPVTYDECLAMPGFHIFAYDGSMLADDNIGERAHFDMQFRQVVPGQAPEATLSFTLPLQQPSGGTGLAVWPLDYEEAVRRDVGSRSWAAQNPWTLVRYETGRMVLHDGLVLHALVRSPSRTPKGLRVTLQGHGVRHEGRWTIYW